MKLKCDVPIQSRYMWYDMVTCLSHVIIVKQSTENCAILMTQEIL